MALIFIEAFDIYYKLFPHTFIADNQKTVCKKSEPTKAQPSAGFMIKKLKDTAKFTEPTWLALSVPVSKLEGKWKLDYKTWGWMWEGC